MTGYKIRDEYIKLGQLLKAANLVSSGLEAKAAILAGEVLVNGDVDQRRGRKLMPGDIVRYRNSEIKVE